MAGRRLMFWIFALWVSLDSSVGHAADINGKKIYELVRPMRLHGLQKRDLKSRPESVNYVMTLGGKAMEMRLQRSDDMLTEDYTETHYTEDGVLMTNKPQDLDFCYYQGKIVGDSESSVSMSICDGLSGFFQTAEQRFLIEPVSSADPEGDHAVYRYEDLSDEAARVCGVTNTSWDHSGDGVPARTSKSRSRSGPTWFQQQKYVELFFVADNREFKKYDSDLGKLRKRVFEIINFINNVYKEINTFVALTGLEAWTDADKISVSSVAGTTLDNFSKWRNSDLVKRQRHDNAQLLSAIDLDGSTVGLAYIGTLCGSLSTGIVQDHNSMASAVGATMAHEMGHNLGMGHDSISCTCPDSSCIMTAALSYDIPQHFSSCSTDTYTDYLNTKNPECLLNVPKAKDLIQPPVCGNGFVETGEECDCGTEQECSNPCCNATTCKLTKGSQCAFGECCENCKIMSSSHICRRNKDECDLPEYCTGKLAQCPDDFFIYNGFPCKNGKGYCYNGQCPQRDDQCIKMWGSTADVGRDYCYNQNTRGEYYAYCKRTNDKYIACQTQDVMCGKLFCENGNTSPNYGRSVTFSVCKATFYGDPAEDYGQVDNGTKCGDGLVCSQNECVGIEMAYKSTNCSEKCKGHGVCDHTLQCRCEPGWLLPDCDKPAESDGLSTGVIIVIVVICILVAVFLMGLIAFILKRKQTKGNVYSQSPDKVQVSVVDELSTAPSQPRSSPKIRPSAPPPPPPPYHVVDFRDARQALKPPPQRV